MLNVIVTLKGLEDWDLDTTWTHVWRERERERERVAFTQNTGCEGVQPGAAWLMQGHQGQRLTSSECESRAC